MLPQIFNSNIQYESDTYLTSTLIIQRCYRLYLLRTFLYNIIKNLPTLSPIDNRWPICSNLFNGLNLELRKIFHKWRCYKFRIKLDQVTRNKMHEKAIASTLFKDKKQSYAQSVHHLFCGDYVKLRQNPKWIKMSQETYDHYIVFADIVHKINRRDGRYVQKLLVITTKGFLIIDHRTLEAKYIIPAAEIDSICLSPFNDGIIAFKLNSVNNDGERNHKGDFLICSNHAIEITAKLYLVILNCCGKPPNVIISQNFDIFFLTSLVTVNVLQSQSLCDEPFAQLPKVIKKGNALKIVV